MSRFLSFAIGGAIGTAVGAAVSAIMAPQRGSALQADVRSTLEAARLAGDKADVAAQDEFRRRYRVRVGDDDALKPREASGES